MSAAAFGILAAVLFVAVSIALGVALAQRPPSDGQGMSRAGRGCVRPCSPTCS